MTLTEPAPLRNTDDLFSLANAICACIDAPVTIEDRYSRVLAFSGRQEEADAMRIATVLGLRVPHDHITDAETRAVMRRLAGSRRVCFFDAASLGGGHVTLGRTAVAVRAGDVLLGFIWAAMPEPLSPALEEWLLRATDVVAVQLQQIAGDADRERRRLSGLVGALLAGGPEGRAALAELGLPSGPSVVVAMDIRGAGAGSHDAQAGVLAEGERLRAALGVHLTVMSRGAVVADLPSSVVAVVPVRDQAGADLILRTCQDFLTRADTAGKAAIGISELAGTVAELPRAHAEAERALRVVRAGRLPTGDRLARCSEVEIESLMLELRTICDRNDIQPSGAFALLRAYDVRKGTTMLQTVQAWLDSHGDIVTAAEALHVHPNTFRYRLRRAGEVGKVDLSLPRERFALGLQLRLFGNAAATGP